MNADEKSNEAVTMETDDFVPISALQHYVYCPRQFALIHIERVFEHNEYTMHGKIQHKNVDKLRYLTNENERREYSLPVWSEKHGLVGICDVVVFREYPVPIEHKSGRKPKIADEVQLCAQSLCLEEMFRTTVLHGELFYYGSRERIKIEISPALRATTLKVLSAVRALFDSQIVPNVKFSKTCPKCSLLNVCLPPR